MEKLNDKWLRLAGVPLVAILGNFIFYLPENTLNDIAVWKGLLFSLIECVLFWEVSRLGIILARKRYPHLKETRFRILYVALWYMVSTVLMRVGITYLYDITLFWGYPMTLRSYWINVLVPFTFTVPIAAIYEAKYLYRQWWATYYEAEQLKKENLQSQLDSLKAQINPHFLFNSLSTLSSLVSEDPKRAEKFIEELSSVYRYLLQTNELPLTTLENELKFIDAYFHLLQTRFGKGIEVQIDVDEAYHSFQLPPLTLQLLLENAVKHNSLSPAKPLQIRIFTDEVNNLFVLNTRRKKNNVVPSSQTGLKNIARKYQLMKQPDVVVKQTDDCFQVMIPLIPAMTQKTPAYYENSAD